MSRAYLLVVHGPNTGAEVTVLADVEVDTRTGGQGEYIEVQLRGRGRRRLREDPDIALGDLVDAATRS